MKKETKVNPLKVPTREEIIEALKEAEAEFERGEGIEWDVVKEELKQRYGFNSI